LGAAIERVRSGGGVVAGVFTLGSGERLAVCDDPQGAAFALRAAAR
jgi:predicted enzyme related to lactoylglutathione lyase